MKVLFKEIRAGDLAAVRARLEKDPGLVHATSKAPPVKDDGQSTLQVAIKASRFPIANLLLDHGVDVNFMEQSEVNAWRAPVVHDAIRAAVLNARFRRNWALPGEPARLEWSSTAERFGEAFAVLDRVVALGADVRRADSFGNSALGRACLDARQVLEAEVPAELDEDLRRVFSLLRSAGADPDEVDQNVGQPLAVHYAATPLARYLG